ncbi:Uridine-cytidine kinase-like 1 [Geodia barretti]|uniref:Uridine kinase n=1 Tax=Geodia barretti TaxID=519541 RepID=A0AA35QZ73_GEOBA|nr:Uridine-cytidine kinase-like 1 [Geodia barretti]
MRNGGRGERASLRRAAGAVLSESAGKKETMELEDGEEALGGGERVISVSSSDSGSEGDEVAALPADTTSPRGNKASTPRKSSTPGERRRRTIYIAGRPPWYDSHGQIAEAFVIGLAGGSASGKTTVARRIIESLGVPWVSLLSMDSFYKALTPEQNKKAAENEYNFDRPDAFDMDLLVETLQKLKEGKHVEIPIYDFSTHAHAKYKHTMYGANVVVFEGIMAFCHAPLLKLMDLKIFVDTDSDIRLARRLRRDIAERGRDLEGVLKQYNKFVKPAFHQFIQPTMQYADIVVPRGGQNRVAVQLIVEHVKDQLKQRGFNNRPKLLAGQRETEALPDSVHILPNKPQVKAMHTVIRNKETKRDDFVFFTNRLACLAMEYAHSFLPFQVRGHMKMWIM